MCVFLVKISNRISIKSVIICDYLININISVCLEALILIILTNFVHSLRTLLQALD